jgi:hypothetical protein
VLLPEIEREIIQGIQQDITKEMSKIPVACLGGFPFTTLSFRQAQKGESHFKQFAEIVHPKIPKSAGFPKLMEQLRAKISTHVKDLEIAKRQEYAEYVESETKQEQAARDAKYNDDLAKMEKEEAEKRRRLEEQRNAAERERKENEVRCAMEREQNVALRKEQSEQKRQYEAQMLAMKQRSENREKELNKRMMDMKRESDARMEDQRKADQQSSARREQELRQKIQQLQSREKVVIHPRHPPCKI